MDLFIRTLTAADLDGTAVVVAEALLSAALSLPFEDAPLVLVPDANTAAVTLLSRYGFQLQRGLRHMHRGSAVPLAGAR